MVLRRFLSGFLLAVIVSASVTGCSSEIDAEQFKLEMSIGDSGSVLAEEDFEVSAQLIAPEGFSEDLVMVIERKTTGDGWTVISDRLASSGDYQIQGLDRLGEGATAEYRVLASVAGSEAPFYNSENTRIESLGGGAYLEKFYRPYIKATFPENVPADMLIPGDSIIFDWGFESDLSDRAVEAHLVAYNEETPLVYESTSTTDSSIQNEYEFAVFNDFVSSFDYELGVEVSMVSNGQTYSVSSEKIEFLTHSLETTIENYLDGINRNCRIEGLICIETLQDYGGDFVDNFSDSWSEIYTYYFGFDDFYLYGNDYQLQLEEGSLEPLSGKTVLEECHDEPYEFESDGLNRFVTFDVKIITGDRYQLYGHLYNDSSVYDFRLTPIECGKLLS